MPRTINREGVLRQFHDKNSMIAQYSEHIERAKRSISADRLLVFCVEDGWGPLCRFMGVSLPAAISFPHSNRGQDFEARLLWFRKQILQNGEEKTEE